ncbi:DUF2842 domain-containing protein [Yunchengibacter salinarum]|uniref:DUF2842 domain-containing protein n=1 Tax=Yunchengibacter salinarum TaxID=3133399 RepID=UPI0035B5B01C
MSEKPRWRNYLGMALLLIGLAIYAFTVAAIGGAMVDWHLAVQTLFYLVTGIVWIFPAIKLMKWMAKD